MNIYVHFVTTFNVDYITRVHAPSYRTMKNWFNEFDRGRRSLKDELRKGRPKTAVVSENIDAVREVIMQDRHVTYREIDATLSISSTSIHSTLHEHLAVKNFCSRWIPESLKKIRLRCFKTR